MPTLLLQPQAQLHDTALAELDGVAGKVEQDLPDAQRIPQQHRQVGVGFCLQGQAFFPSLVHQQHTDIHQQLLRREWDGFHGQRTTLDSGEIQNVVDDSQQMLARMLDFFQAALLLLRQQRAAQAHLRQADDGIQRSADFMAHGGQKFRFHLCQTQIGFFRALLRQQDESQRYQDKNHVDHQRGQVLRHIAVQQTIG